MRMSVRTYGNRLFKSQGVLWKVMINDDMGQEYLYNTPLCPTENCRIILDLVKEGFWCINCKKLYPNSKGHIEVADEVQRKWQGSKLKDFKIQSLDLPPTKVKDFNEDENYWVEARIGEKNGKRMATVYFGEKVKRKQNKQDYSQIFLDLEDEQLRFDKTNKNPMKLLATLTAEFQDSTTVLGKNLQKNKKE